MPFLSHLDQRRVLAAIGEIHRVSEMDALRSKIVRVASDLIGADFGSFNVLSKRTSQILASVRFPDVSRRVDRYLPAFVAYFPDHPMLRFSIETGRLDAQRFCDVVSRTELERNRLHNEYLRPIGIRHQMIISFDRPDESSVAVSMNRGAREFSDRDVTVLNLLRPHFAQAMENLTELVHARAVMGAMEDTARRDGRGLLLVDRSHRIVWISVVARQLMAEWLRVDIGTGNLLPDPIGAWLRSRQERTATLHGANVPLVLEGVGRKWTVTPAGTDEAGNATLVLSRTDARPCDPLLTARENEVLGWIAEGKSNPEIARILNLSVRTIYKHVEHIFAKLGVESRAGAMMHALRHANCRRE